MKSPSKTVLGVERSGIRAVFDLASTMEDVIHLEMGEPNFPTPEHVRAAAAAAADGGYTKYAPNAGFPELREALAEKVRRRNGLAVDAAQVVVTTGGIAALFSTVLALCDPGDELLISDPAWPNYRMIGDLLGVRVVRYPLRSEDGMQPRADLIAPHIGSRTKVLVLNSPSNPTGTVLGRERLAELLALAEAHDLWVVSDEVYDEIVFDGEVAPSAATVGDPERIVTVFSFSKTYAMTGWRVGYAVAPRDLAPLLVKTQEPITACVNAPAQMAALAAVTGPQDDVAAMRASYRRRRDRVADILAAAAVPFVRPAGAFYVWIDVSAANMADTAFGRRLLLEERVAVTPGSAFGPGSGSFVRVSLASEPEELYEGVRRLAAAVRTWGS